MWPRCEGSAGASSIDRMKLDLEEKLDPRKKLDLEKKQEVEARALERALARIRRRRENGGGSRARPAVKVDWSKHARKAANTRKRRASRRKREIQAQNAPALPRRGVAKLGLPGWKVLLARMEPGRVYRMADFRELMPEYSYSGIKTFVLSKLVPGGLIEQLDNPEYERMVAENPAYSVRYLYRMAEKAPYLAQEWRSALGEW